MSQKQTTWGSYNPEKQADEIERLRHDRDGYKAMWQTGVRMVEKREAEAAALREALEYVVKYWVPPTSEAYKKAKSALASGAGEKAAAVLKAADDWMYSDDPEADQRLREAVAARKGE